MAAKMLSADAIWYIVAVSMAFHMEQFDLSPHSLL